MNDCRRHKCEKKCGESHGHSVCFVKVSYNFPECGHPSPDQKPCTREITWKCKKIEKVHLKCDHSAMKECWIKNVDVVCKEPCNRTR